MFDVLRAELKHAREIESLIAAYSEKSLLLEKSYEEICRDIHSFFVAVTKDPGGCEKVIGCVSLYVYGPNLSEVRSLVVLADYQNKGIGAALVRTVIHKAKSAQIEKLIALTLRPDFFIKLGFAPIEREALPAKIWNDCVTCSKLYDCPESALIFFCS